MNKTFPTFKEAAVFARNTALEDYCVVLIQRQENRFVTIIEEIEEQPEKSSSEKVNFNEQIAKKETLKKTLIDIGNKARKRLEIERAADINQIEKEKAQLVSGNIVELDD